MIRNIVCSHKNSDGKIIHGGSSKIGIYLEKYIQN